MSCARSAWTPVTCRRRPRASARHSRHVHARGQCQCCGYACGHDEAATRCSEHRFSRTFRPDCGHRAGRATPPNPPQGGKGCRARKIGAGVFGTGYKPRSEQAIPRSRKPPERSLNEYCADRADIRSGLGMFALTTLPRSLDALPRPRSYCSCSATQAFEPALEILHGQVDHEMFALTIFPFGIPSSIYPG